MTDPPEFTDRKVRDMLEKAGFDVAVNDDVKAFARFMRAAFAEYETHLKSFESQRTVKTLVAATMISAALTALIPLVLHKLGWL